MLVGVINLGLYLNSDSHDSAVPRAGQTDKGPFSSTVDKELQAHGQMSTCGQMSKTLS